MSPFGALFDGGMVSSGLYCRSVLGSPWGFRYASVPVAMFHAVLEGEAVLEAAGGPPLPLAAGDLLLLPRGGTHDLRDGSGVTPSFIDPQAGDFGTDGSCPTVRAGGAGQRTELVCGFFRLGPTHDHPLLTFLPSRLHLRAGGEGDDGDGVPALRGVRRTMGLLADEVRAGVPGRDPMVERLLEVLLAYVLRAWLARQDEGASHWARVMRDPEISRALDLIHDRPDRAWTVAELAREVRLSRSTFAARFTLAVGEPPRAHLTSWRLQRATSLLRTTDWTVARVASAVGYDSEPAFSSAFKRRFGTAPGSYRRSA